MELVVFVLLAMTGVGVQSACTDVEFQSVKSCWINYDAVFIRQFGRSGSCNTPLINTTFCGYYNDFVVCGNGKSLSNTQCRPYIIEQVNNYIVIPCKIENFQAACPNAAKINSGSEHLHGGECLLLLIFCTFLVAKGLSSAF